MDSIAEPQLPVTPRYYFGGAYETTGSTWKKYYSFAGQTIAMRDAEGFKYFLSDHLGSTSVVLDDDGTVLEQQRYLPFGGVRTDLPNPGYRITNTDLTYTGQRDLPGTGLMDYKARFREAPPKPSGVGYSPSLGRFIQPDSIVPGIGSGSFNRYSYVLNNPLAYTDPTGHRACDDVDKNGKCITAPGGGGSGFGGLPKKPKKDKDDGGDPPSTPQPTFDPGAFEEAPCGGMILSVCESEQPISPEDVLVSLLPTAGDTCDALHLDPQVCDSRFEDWWSNGQPQVIYPTDWFREDVADFVNDPISLGSKGLGLSEGMHWWHLPTQVGMTIDATAQWIADSGRGDNYSFWQKAVRAGVVAGEGQVISSYAAFAAGTDGTAGVLTGPADIIIIGGAYVIASTGASYLTDQFNQEVVFPLIDDYIP